MSATQAKPATSIESILADASKLKIADRVELVHQLNEQIDREDPWAALTPAQAADLKVRIAEFESGQAVLVDGREAMDSIRAKYKR